MMVIMKVEIGTKFKDHTGTFEVVKVNEKINDNWFCKNIKEEVGLWSYSSDYILKHLI